MFNQPALFNIYLFVMFVLIIVYLLWSVQHSTPGVIYIGKSGETTYRTVMMMTLAHMTCVRALNMWNMAFV